MIYGDDLKKLVAPTFQAINVPLLGAFKLVLPEAPGDKLQPYCKGTSRELDAMAVLDQDFFKELGRKKIVGGMVSGVS